MTEWISAANPVPKETGVRITVDFRELNKCLICTEFPNPTPLEAVHSIPSTMRFFSLLDGLKGYHMIELDEESVNLTTFATPFCLHQYLRLPMGIRPAGAIFG